MSRLIAPHASVAGPAFSRKAGSRSVPSGMVYAAMVMGDPPYDLHADKTLRCDGDADRDLGVHPTNDTCLSHVDSVLAWWPMNAIVWRGDTDKHCVICKMTGNATSYHRRQGRVRLVTAAAPPPPPTTTTTSTIRRRLRRHLAKVRALEWGLPVAPKSSGVEVSDLQSTGNPWYVLKSWNTGFNWTYIKLPPHLQGGVSFAVDPTNATTLYAVQHDCISRSYDEAATWSDCWEAPGLNGSISGLEIKDSLTMLVLRGARRCAPPTAAPPGRRSRASPRSRATA